MNLKIFQIDAFNSKLFRGNPAAVVPLDKWLPEEQMQQIAFENNLSETAFFVPEEKGFYIRWFAPLVEIPLCGHATLATAHVLFEHLDYKHDEIHFNCKSGILKVKKDGKYISMNFPSDQMVSEKPPSGMVESLGIEPLEVYKGRSNYMLVYENEQSIQEMKPNFAKLAKVDARSVIVTAKGNEVDFVSRFFAPKVGINEDPVTGSAHTGLIPFWAQRLKKTELSAKQLSERIGNLQCTHLGDRVEMAGEAVTYLIGEIIVP